MEHRRKNKLVISRRHFKRLVNKENVKEQTTSGNTHMYKPSSSTPLTANELSYTVNYATASE